MIQLQTGGVYLYSPKGIDRERLMLVISAPGVLDSRRRFITGLTVLSTHDGDTLTVPITVGGARRYVNTTQPMRLIRDWFLEHHDVLSRQEMEAVRAMRRIAEDL
ncbi:hypothetical protein HS048_35490 [Planomonospora sp. ID91781]|uniref:Uncharacterized protein n=1 Tax=Planobispora siamensis TaxID=936338 RepID=A0A8J3SSA4_9ACTN|nr:MULTISPECIES: hypothetical protein [Streptosporangiaceae]MBG0825977.1 hypothetical protein [Planomonospora sp. ID91781]GIH97479.1 hypothetical protein Psi01_81090 [Planobispora siamensis]